MGLIYRYSHPFNDHGYVGKTEATLEIRDKRRFYKSAVNDSKTLKAAMAKYGKEHFTLEVLEDGIIDPETLNQRERCWIRHFDDFHNGYNQTQGGEGFTSERAREINLKRVADGTNPFLGGGIARETNRSRVEDGSHHFLGESNPSHQRVADGTHHFLSGEISRETNLRLIEEGTHHCLNKGFQSMGRYFSRLAAKDRRREFYRWVSVILVAKEVCEQRVYRKRTREGNFDKPIQDTSEATQLTF